MSPTPGSWAGLEENMGEILCIKARKPGCCGCCSEREGPQHHQEPQHVEVESTLELTGLNKVPHSVTSFPSPWFHTLQVERSRKKSRRSNSDPFQERKFMERHQWRRGLPFGTATSYLHLEKLCEGSYSTVYKGISRINGQLVALKVISLETEEGVPVTAIREASLLKHLKHANIVVLHDIFQTTETLTFVFEYMVDDTFIESFQNMHNGTPLKVKVFCVNCFCLCPKEQFETKD